MAKYKNLEERLLANSVRADMIGEHSCFYNDEFCWLWLGKYRGGYPAITRRYKSGPRKGKVYNTGAHRLSIIVFKGRRMTPKMVGKHLCNVSGCINPSHLEGGTQASNVQQCVKDKRHKTPFRDPDMRTAI